MNYQTADEWIVIRVGGEAITGGKEQQVAADLPRMWTSADGRFTCYAGKISNTADSVTLKRMTDGEVVTVPLVRLSEADRQVALRVRGGVRPSKRWHPALCGRIDNLGDKAAEVLKHHPVTIIVLILSSAPRLPGAAGVR